MIKASKGFTLLEMMVVVVLLAVIAAFGIPSYNNSLEKSDEREAVYSLRFIAEALKVYRVRNVDYPNFDMPQVDDINTTLSIRIIEQNMDYDCQETAPDMICTAVSNYGWQIEHDTSLSAANNPYCAVANCPSNLIGASYNNMF